MASILLSALKEDRKRVLRRKMLCWQCKSHNWTSSLVRPSSNMFNLSQFHISNFSHSTGLFVCSASIASASAPTVELCLWRVNLMLDMLPVETHPQGWIKISTKQIEYTNTKTASGKKTHSDWIWLSAEYKNTGLPLSFFVWCILNWWEQLILKNG